MPTCCSHSYDHYLPLLTWGCTDIGVNAWIHDTNSKVLFWQTCRQSWFTVGLIFWLFKWLPVAIKVGYFGFHTHISAKYTDSAKSSIDRLYLIYLGIVVFLETRKQWNLGLWLHNQTTFLFRPERVHLPLHTYTHTSAHAHTVTSTHIHAHIGRRLLPLKSKPHRLSTSSALNSFHNSCFCHR